MPTLRVNRSPEVLVSDDKRVIPRYLDFGHPPRIRSIFRRLMKIRRSDVPRLLAEVRQAFHGRHRDLEEAFRTSYELAARHIRLNKTLSEDHKRLIGAYFTMEYSIESAALFNPSLVPHPNQSGLPDGSQRFLMSLRATGEGHVSSIVFRRGVVDKAGAITFDPPPRFAHSARPVPDKKLDKALFIRKLHETAGNHGRAPEVLDKLDDEFTVFQLRAALEESGRSPERPVGLKRIKSTMLWLAKASYDLRFPEDCMPSETVIFPATEHEGRGMEDLRLVQFVEEDGRVRYYGTYTAFDGFRIHPMLLQTDDFRTFHMAPLSGRYAKNKGMALFPRKVDGYYMMVSRHDGESLFLLASRDLHVWNVSTKLQTPAEPWELTQLGNCGSPLETDAGWIVITHGVGPMRRYCIGATLLDRQNPEKVLGRLRKPLLEPLGEEREGYVPNVVYSCGSMLHRGRLVVPFAVSDSRTCFASVSVKALVRQILHGG